ncbi:hypothetical protein QWY93_04885 [Echinicola jeungdonensis]|uniref:Outer membrane protein beta-barrel domain-containing protein n=1 Tax=Echinicola jeungdonensis TaxID=709343 RepID=A0ABV5J579_9BACT|nr:hypothetical protein [Echinicola jeungdonensis]MDN3668659.1 hypothetical protein [Echinicola jeungdonensis]
MKNKKLLVLPFFFLLITFGLSSAQDTTRVFKPFKVDVGINLTFPSDSKLAAGGGLFVEPRYGINDQFHIGLNIASNIIGEGDFIFNNTEATIKAQAISNLSFITEYHFNKENVRPFLGFMAGMYRRSDYEIVDNDDGTVITRRNNSVHFGLAPRIGLIAGKFRLNTTYHFTGKNITDFLSIGMGIQFGGGKINKPKRNYESNW